MTEATRRRDWWGWAARAAFSGAVLTIAVVMVDVSTLPRALRSIPVSAFLLAFALNLIGSIVVPAIQTRIALSTTQLDLSLARLVAINLMVRFYVLVFPRPAAIGIRWWAYRGRGQDARGSKAAALMMFERVVQALVMTGAAVVLIATERHRLPAATDGLLLAGIALFVLTLVSSAAFVWQPAGMLPRWLLQRRGVPLMVRERATRLLDAVAAFPGLGFARIAAVIGLSIVYFVLFVGSFWVLLYGLDVNLNFAAVAWIRVLVFMLTMIPVTIGGIGVREVGFVALLKLYDVAESDALAAAVAALAVQLLIGGMGLLVAMWWHWRGRRPEHELAATPSHVPE